MDLQRYRERRIQLDENTPHFRRLCLRCRQPEFTCYCPVVRSFDPRIKFVILIHPMEVRRRIATGRMAHLCLENSLLIMGQDYTQERQVNQILENPSCVSVVLYPGLASTNLTHLDKNECAQLFPQNKELVIFVIDGTWNTARKMIRQSENLHSLPRICFSPARPSTFRVRKQPAPDCYSTIEAIHSTIELIGPGRGFDTTTHKQDRLLNVFDHMVEQQLRYIHNAKNKSADRGVRWRHVHSAAPAAAAGRDLP